MKKTWKPSKYILKNYWYKDPGLRLEEGQYEVLCSKAIVICGLGNYVISRTLVSRGYRFNCLGCADFWFDIRPMYVEKEYFIRLGDCVSAVDNEKHNRKKKIKEKVVWRKTY